MTRKTQHLRHAARTTFDNLRAEALFASRLQPADQPSAGQVQDVVTSTLRKLGIRGCAAHMAGEFGDHPETAADRMKWAQATIRTTYPTRPATPALILRPVPATAS
ncbi:hypothetical protein [Actinoplanes sp. TBRC 11911]|uniref:hypothetical protein n=1 Tax=Actinoplanes sp. TBRC 11911 TaxID=2729386 RepID=UPI001B7D5CA3|nr:hypothetical protein [Actinoplanes sp. TBRC 11911]